MTKIFVVNLFVKGSVHFHFVSHFIFDFLAGDSEGLTLSIERVNLIEFLVIEAVEWEILTVAVLNLNLYMLC